MAYPDVSSPRSVSGSSIPTHLAAGISSTALSFSLYDVSSWKEVDSSGQITANPLGTSGVFSVVLEYGSASEEKILCSALNPTTGLVTVWSSGSLNGRGYDGTAAQAHSGGSVGDLNAFPVWTATESLQTNQGLIQALSKVASVTAADSSITIAGTATAPTVAVAPSGVTAGAYGSSLATPTITVDAKGRVTAATTNIALSPQATTTTATTFGSTSMRHYPCDTTAGAFTVTLPLSPANGGQWLITLKAGTNALTIAAQTGNTINGLPSIQLTTAGQSVLLQFILSTATFTVIGASSTPNNGSGFAVDGDLTGFMPNPTVDGLRGRPVSATAPSSGQALAWDGTNWIPTSLPSSLPPSGSASGDLAGSYPGPSLAALSPSPVGSYGSATAVPAITVDAKGRTTSVTSTSIQIVESQVTNLTTDLAARLPLSGGTMSGSIAMGSNRVTGLPTPGGSTDPLVASQSMGAPSPSIHTNTYPLKAWNADPANTAISISSVSMSSGVQWFSAISIPYAMTLNQVWIYVISGAAYQATGGFYGFGIYDTSGNLLVSTGNMQPTGFTGLSGPLGWPLLTPYAIAPGNYMIGFIYYTGTGAGTPATPAFGRLANNAFSAININCPTPSSGKLDQRCCQAGTGRTGLYSPMNVTPTQSGTNFWVAVA